MFDEDLNMDLSQHLFELQLARHIQRSTQFKSSIRHTQPLAVKEGLAETVAKAAMNAGKAPSPWSVFGTRDPRPSSGNCTFAVGDTGLRPEMFEMIGTALNDLKASHGQTNQLLTKVTEMLESSNRILISTQNCQARSDSMYSNGHRHELINQQGEYPAGSGLPGLWTYDGEGWKKPTDDTLARYLQFYGIGIMRMILTPPVLPPFLAGTYDLKLVEGVPSDGEVKMVHAVIRALNDVANDGISVPVLYDADLAMRLSMHLFSIQMARYRDKYPCIIFPTDTTHTPPQLPAHIPVELEPVTGPPSDDQIKSVQNALRLSENLANVPSMFDADLSMRLSQHLFDIQFERYLRQVADGNSSALMMSSQARNANMNESDGAEPPGMQNDSLESTRVQGDRDVLTTGTTGSGSIYGSTEVQFEPQQSLAEVLKIGLENTNKVLGEMRDGLEGVKQVMIVTQQSMARDRNWSYGRSGPMYTLLNATGEAPH
ncbi:hypothetical protein FRC06_003566, partial [Ceratobasidium sp. 370]